MTKSTLLAALVVLAAAPAALAQHPDHADHQHHHQQPAAKPAAPLHKTATTRGVTATFHLEAPEAARYTCPMHPEVEAAHAGSCPTCKMALVKQTHKVAVSLANAESKRAITGAKVRLAIEDGHGLRQELTLKARAGGTYEGAVHLMPGKQALHAHVTGAGASVAVVSTAIDVK